MLAGMALGAGGGGVGDLTGSAGDDFESVERVPDEESRHCGVGQQASDAEDRLPGEAVVHG